jgi:hypothetical protein
VSLPGRVTGAGWCQKKRDVLGRGGSMYSPHENTRGKGMSRNPEHIVCGIE